MPRLRARWRGQGPESEASDEDTAASQTAETLANSSITQALGGASLSAPSSQSRPDPPLHSPGPLNAPQRGTGEALVRAPTTCASCARPARRGARGELGPLVRGGSEAEAEAEAEEEAEEDEEVEDEAEDEEDEDIPGFTVSRVRGSIQIPAAPSESRVSADASPAALTLDRSPIGEGGLGLCGGQSGQTAKRPKGKWAHGYKVKVEKWNSGTVERCKSVMCAEVQSVFIRRYGSRQPASHLT
ncbi:hypothetical protein B2J93_802 [Marssonina coronariae]|uniref:Uncharacterized protein n=1 Tax=Diplocarpon coronariae TaxID=2795749 RepID=A0A218ZF39_9HELO|nr:hypothetical protein B2J93_802 [Marssonina coronariae]